MTDLEAYAPGSSMVQVRIGNRIFDAVCERSCHTCTHPARMFIEERIIQNWSYRRIAQSFSGIDFEVEPGVMERMPTIGYSSIRNHFLRGHMPLQAATLRQLAERRANQIGSTYEQAAGQFVDQVVLAEAVVTRSYERLASGEIEPEVRDGLQAAKFLQDVNDRTQAGLDSEAWSQAMQIYFETARRFMPDEMWAQFTQTLTADPILRALARRMENPEAEVVDGEIALES